MCSLTKPFSSTDAVDLDCSRHGRLKYGQSGHHVRTIGGMVGGSYLWQVDVDLRVRNMTYILACRRQVCDIRTPELVSLRPTT